MGNPEHLFALGQGRQAWLSWWREHYPSTPADLQGADLSGMNLDGYVLIDARLNGANLERASLRGTNLIKAILPNARLEGADLRGSQLGYAVCDEADFRNTRLAGALCTGAQFRSANFSGAQLGPEEEFEAAGFYGTDLRRAIFKGADLTKVGLRYALCVETDFSNAVLSGCLIYGASFWSPILEGAVQKALVITRENESPIEVDDVELAQFIYLLINNRKIRNIIETLTSRVVLILGRFTSKRKMVLNALREELRNRDLSPIIFDFERPSSRDLTETISILAHLARFVIADLSEPRSVPQELMSIIPHLPSVPIQPLLVASEEEYSMFEHFLRYPWVLPTFRYIDQDHLIKSLADHVLGPAQSKSDELRR
jgi:uncharacterized protein YjbI with pentapeptide repeats